MRQRSWNRSLLGPALAALIGLSTPVAAQDDTDEDLYRKPGFFLTGGPSAAGSPRRPV